MSGHYICDRCGYDGDHADWCVYLRPVNERWRGHRTKEEMEAESNHERFPSAGATMTLEQLRELTAIQAEDECLWAPAARVETAYTQQALRYLTRAIEGEWTFDEARDAIREMMP